MNHGKASDFVQILGFVLLSACLLHSTNVRAEAGLDFPGNGHPANANSDTTIRFQFNNPQNTGMLLHGSNGDGVTYMWRAYYRPQTKTPGYFTCFFYSDNNSWFEGGGRGDGYGMHPYPVNSSGQTDRNELNRQVHSLADATDFPANTANWADYLVSHNQWYLHVVRIINNGGGNVRYEFYPDYENNPDLLLAKDYTGRSGQPQDPVIAWGDAPHAGGQEIMSGILRDIHIYSDLLSLSEINQEIASAGSSAGTLWYYKPDPTPTDIADESGSGNDPVWIGSQRPGLYGSTEQKVPRPPSNFEVVD